jgi:hypothetical protein
MRFAVKVRDNGVRFPYCGRMAVKLSVSFSHPFFTSVPL